MMVLVERFRVQGQSTSLGAAPVSPFQSRPVQRCTEPEKMSSESASANFPNQSMLDISKVARQLPFLDYHDQQTFSRSQLSHHKCGNNGGPAFPLPADYNPSFSN